MSYVRWYRADTEVKRQQRISLKIMVSYSDLNVNYKTNICYLTTVAPIRPISICFISVLIEIHGTCNFLPHVIHTEDEKL